MNPNIYRKIEAAAGRIFNPDFETLKSLENRQIKYSTITIPNLVPPCR